VPRRRSRAGAILEFFRSGDSGEVKAVYQLVQDVVRERFYTPSKSVAKRVKAQRSTKPASTFTPATQTQEVA
jgi:hypothetical protein